MKRLTLTTLLSLTLASTALAQDQFPGSHFVTNWDADSNGAVSLQEATTRRDDIFTTFDADEDGKLSADEYDMFDQARANDRAQLKAGKGNGHGKGMGEEQGMQRAFNDTDGDGSVSRDEFMARVPGWFAMMDGNGDGSVTTDDFGPGN